MKTKKLYINKTMSMFIVMVVLFFFFSLLTKGSNLNSSNINNLVMQNSYIIILSIGMLLCTLTGNIDLGIGSVVAAAGAVAATLIVNFHVNFLIAMLAALLVGAAFGVFNGLIISKLKISPFIVTLATMLIARGLCYVVLDGQTKGPLPDEYTFISSGFLPSIKVGPLDLICVIIALLLVAFLFWFDISVFKERDKHNLKTLPLWGIIVKDSLLSVLICFLLYKLGTYNGFPVVLLILFFIIFIYTFITNHTVLGSNIYALGGNERAANLSGINTSKTMFIVYLNMGVLCGLVGILLSGRNGSATAKAGESFELDAITACYLGGVSTKGGKGTVMNAIVGALIMGILNNGMSLCGLDSNIQKIIKGLVLILAITLDIVSRKNLLSKFKKKEA